MKNIIFTLIIILIAVSCVESNREQNASPEYLKEINDWHSKRTANLKKESGWLNLVGLHWLEEGENTFGSDNGNDIVFPKGKAAKFIGKIIKQDSLITTIISSGVSVISNEEEVTEIIMKADITGDKTILQHNSLRWFIIKRGDKYGIRLRDLEAELLANFDGIDRFVVDENWKINAKFVKFDEPRVLQIPTVLGTIEEDYSPGKITFSLQNIEYELLPTSAGKGLFIVFADLTSGEETYGAGRFLYIDGPDSNSNVVLDFNKAYNPPCAFTKYATCPLPPDENKLRVRIEAGEKNFGKGH